MNKPRGFDLLDNLFLRDLLIRDGRLLTGVALVELLVIIAIVALLMGILMPAVQVMCSSMTSVCQ